MHIQDGFLPPLTIGVGFACAGALTLATLPRLKQASAPRVAMVTSVFFVGTLLAFPVGPSTVHLSFLALAGVVLGAAAFPAVLVGLALQRFLLQQGGVASLGVNATVMGVGALVAAGVFHLGKRRPTPLRGGLAGFLGTLVALVLFGAALLSAGEELTKVAYACLVLHAPVLLVEAVMTAAVVGFLLRVEPSLLGVPKESPP